LGKLRDPEDRSAKKPKPVPDALRIGPQGA
jgi:hypothetical protein